MMEWESNFYWFYPFESQKQRQILLCSMLLSKARKRPLSAAGQVGEKTTVSGAPAQSWSLEFIPPAQSLVHEY